MSAQAPPLTLVSHALCPYVQRAAIVLLEKGVPFARRDVNLAAKPAWFLAVSPLGKTPVLLTDNTAVFESAVICEYLEETNGPPLHPSQPLDRARHRAWMEFGSAMLATVGGFYTAPDAASLQARRTELQQRFTQLEAELSADGPYFSGTGFSMVDAVFAPVFRYLDAFEVCGEAGWLENLPRMQRWRIALAARPSVQQAVAADYPQRLLAFLRTRGSELARRIAPARV
ncbi:glutathione S-transferase family protein [Polaromonas sp.]|uniref:glutathione S-transferase family protein n=1 Tax=Polaromonas sp. TaxID=1869339 RepID=UPI00248A12DE|nr:glutathione S-transferase family protein [Polaromonas sp.]MDI1273865.1 glutathione S-transferase family protein [Polaromonas sp.]